MSIAIVTPQTYGPLNQRSKRLSKLIRLLILLSVGTIFALIYWLVVAFLTFRRGNRVSLSPENASGDSRLKEILSRAYPDGLEGSDYTALLGFLSSRVPADTIARTVAGPARKEIAAVLADVSSAGKSEREDEVKARLDGQGFEDWVRRYA